MKQIQKLMAVLAVFSILSASCADAQTINQAENETQESESSEIYQGLIKNPQPAYKKNTYGTLNVATYITKADGTYFIADCYHDRIIYSDIITKPLAQWNVLTDEVHYAHTIATDGVAFLVDDTENNRLLAFQKIDGSYFHTQTLDGIGLKPHFITYYEKEQAFMAWSSITGEMYIVKRHDEPDEAGAYPLYVEKIIKIDELYGVYVRSFTIIGDTIYFVSGYNNQKIIQADITRKSEGVDFEITERYDVPQNIAGMAQLYKIQDYYYITVSTDSNENQDYATIIRAKSLEDLSAGEYEDIYDEFGISGGTPYYINEIEGRYYMTHHRTSENIIAFDVNDNVIGNVEVVY